MNRFQKLLFTLAVTAFPALSHADGLIFKLPPDGTSATYKLEMSGDGREISGRLQVSSVGVVVEGEEKSRWIELKMTTFLPGREEAVVNMAKLLIPEKHLGKGKAGFENFTKGLQRLEDLPVRAILPKSNVGPVPLFLSGPLEDQKELEPAAVESSLGTKQCAGISGTMVVKTGSREQNVDVETRLHEDAPFGVVQLKMDADLKGAKMLLTLEKVEEGAKSELPDEAPAAEEEED